MSKSRVTITAGAVFLSAALAVIFCPGQSEVDQKATIQEAANPIPSLNPEQVLTSDCEILEHKPESILITAAIGAPDTGYGIDYYEAEHVYNDMEKFVNEFSKHNIKVALGD